MTQILTAPLTAGETFAPTPTEIAALQARFGLSYHVPYSAHADELVGLRGKRVLEIGGSLPAGFVRDQLGAAQWTAVEELSYWRIVGQVENLTGSPLQRPADSKLTSATPQLLDRDYVLLEGAIEDAPDALAGQFDVAFSIACFEHVSRLPKALDRIARLLRPGGQLFTMFSPVWSAHNGHHLPEITDRAGRTFKFDRSPIPPWGHLLAGPSGLYEFLCKKTDPAAAEEMVYYVYHAPHISRLFLEDYVNYFQQSPLQVKICSGIFPAEIPAKMQSELERLHPDRTHFRFNGLLAVLEKPLA
jgi:SAM-dependent methyltransferase